MKQATAFIQIIINIINYLYLENDELHIEVTVSIHRILAYTCHQQQCSFRHSVSRLKVYLMNFNIDKTSLMLSLTVHDHFIGGFEIGYTN